MVKPFAELVPQLLLAGLAGLAVGVCYFTSLAWAVRRVVQADQPAPLLTGSYAVRSALMVGFLVYVVRVGWPHLLAAAAGFMAARSLILRRLRLDEIEPPHPN